jgi:hypothetical protein
MRRREFISFAAGTALAGPLRALAQEPGRVYRLALVLPIGRDEPASIAFLDELRTLGFVEGQNLVIIGGLPTSNEQAPTVIPAILKAKPDVIATGGDFIGHAFQKATQSIPLVVMTEDMVAAGFAASLARPGGNITGMRVRVALPGSTSYPRRCCTSIGDSSLSAQPSYDCLRSTNGLRPPKKVFCSDMVQALLKFFVNARGWSPKFCVARNRLIYPSSSQLNLN